MSSERRTHGVRRFRTRATPAALLAVAMVLTVWIGLLAGLLAGFMQGQWTLRGALSMGLAFLRLVSLTQWLGVAVWAVLTGALFVVGLGGRGVRSLGLAALSGVLIPIGLGLLGHAEAAISPAFRATQGPFDRPLLSLPLLLYCIAAPLLLARLTVAPRRREALR